MRDLRFVWVAFAVGCGSVGGDPPDGPVPIDGPAVDAPSIDAPVAIDGPSARCNPARPFDTPVALSTLNTASDDHAPVLSPDERTI